MSEEPGGGQSTATRRTAAIGGRAKGAAAPPSALSGAEVEAAAVEEAVAETCAAVTAAAEAGASPAPASSRQIEQIRLNNPAIHFMTMVDDQLAQSIVTVLLLKSREKTPLPGAVSAHRPLGTP